MSGLLSRVGAFFFEADAPAPEAPRAPVPAGSPAQGAAVLGPPAAVVALAAACAGELRARSRAAAALLCVWRSPASPAPPPDPEVDVPPARSPAGATTPGARRLAGRLVARDLAATACGRLAWLVLDPDPVIAAGQFRRCRSLAEAPHVLAVAGPRPPEFEPLLADLDVCVAVLPRDLDPALSELALATLPTRDRVVLPPLPAGPPRWAALAGLARLRSLPEVGR
jgi:hypothetical protein